MYENYTRQALPSKRYRELLGSALCVFNSNAAFVIENILRVSVDRNWYVLVDKEFGRLKPDIKDTIEKVTGNSEIYDLFSELVDCRNRIIHSYQITDTNKEQVLVTKTRIADGNKQFVITEEYLLDFITKNQKLCELLYSLRTVISSKV